MDNLRTSRSVLIPTNEIRFDGHENVDLIVSNDRSHFTQKWGFVSNEDREGVSFLGDLRNYNGVFEEVKHPISGVVKNEWIQTGTCRGENNPPTVRRNLDPCHHFSHLNLFTWDSGMLAVAQNLAKTRDGEIKHMLMKTPEYERIMSRWVKVCEGVGGCPINMYWDQLGLANVQKFDLKGHFDEIPVYEGAMFYPPSATCLVSPAGMEMSSDMKRDYYLAILNMLLFTFDLGKQEPLKIQSLRRHMEADFRRMSGESAEILYKLTIHSFTRRVKKVMRKLSVYGLSQAWFSGEECRQECLEHGPIFYWGRTLKNMRVKNWHFVYILENIFGEMDYVANSCIIFNGWLVPKDGERRRGRKPLAKTHSLTWEKESLDEIACHLTCHGFAHGGYLEN
uniref:Non-structural protein NS n=1 Tax=Wenzhou Shrimp Virus 1 TaxID=1608095 RepID=A0A877J7B1_9VIRU|nr:non-structural protein NS [Wenzhou Shrimp Virus 1]